MSNVVPEQIQIPPDAGGGGGAPPGGGPTGGGGDPGPDEYKAAIDVLQDLLTRETDNALSTELATLVQKMYALVSGQEDTEMKMQGADPKIQRSMAKATGAGGGGGY